MLRKVALEEHFAIPETMEGALLYGRDSPSVLGIPERLLDMMDYRLMEMDENGIELTILSLNSPAIQEIYKVPDAIETARIANDRLAETVEKRRTRFRGFAALPMQDPEAAILELRRAVTELGMLGVLVNGFSQIDSPDNDVYLDDRRYDPFWSELQKLDVPFYLHPREPMPGNVKMLENHYWLHGAAWAFGVDTSTHALRMMSSGIFDRYPRLKLLIGHLGEGLPFLVWRCDNMLSKRKRGMPAKHLMAYYMNKNVWVTTSGQFHTPPLICTMLQMGADRILFSTDYPFEEISDASNWFDACPISESDKRKIGRQNAIDLFKLDIR
ncbi:MAG: amidohydrolase family protein [Oscillospiraceae bacterium]|nr:amidohydrolase family protein [Oscillospiraceae bacterium]